MTPERDKAKFPVSPRPENRLSRIPAFLALQKNTVGLLIMVILVDMGERMGERFLPIYLMALGGGFLWQISPGTNFVTAFVFGLIGTIGFSLFGRDVRTETPKGSTG